MSGGISIFCGEDKTAVFDNGRFREVCHGERG